VLGAGRFEREVEILGRLRHSGIVPVLEFGAAGSLLYLVMPYVPGENLRTRQERTGPSRCPRSSPSRPSWPRPSAMPRRSSLLAVLPDLPTRVDSAVRAALEKEPARRPRSGAELLERTTA
jgi:serine/threonine protein kinase